MVQWRICFLKNSIEVLEGVVNISDLHKAGLWEGKVFKHAANKLLINDEVKTVFKRFFQDEK